MNDEQKNPLVSVIIPTYKRPDMLGRAINSVLNQTYKNIEIIVVDDNDEDSEYRKETEEFMNQYSDIDNLVYLKHKFNRGGGPARNTGIENSMGEYIAFLDDDDEFLPQKIELQVEAFLNSDIDKLGLVYCGIEIRDEKNNIIKYQGVNAEINPLDHHLIENIAPGPTIFTKKSILKELNGFNDLISGQEYDLTLRILKKGYNVKYVNDYLVIVYRHTQERITNTKDIVKEKTRIYNQRKNSFDYVNEKETIKLVNYKYYRFLTEYYLINNNKREAFDNFLEAIKYKKLKTRNFIILFKFIFGLDSFEFFKTKFYKLKFWYYNRNED